MYQNTMWSFVTQVSKKYTAKWRIYNENVPSLNQNVSSSKKSGATYPFLAREHLHKIRPMMQIYHVVTSPLSVYPMLVFLSCIEKSSEYIHRPWSLYGSLQRIQSAWSTRAVMFELLKNKTNVTNIALFWYFSPCSNRTKVALFARKYSIWCHVFETK